MVCKGIQSYLDENYEMFMINILVGGASGLFLTFTGFYLTLNKKFRHHPMPLVGIACLLQALYFFSYFDIFFVCKFNQIEIFAYAFGLWTSLEEKGINGLIEWLTPSKWMVNYFTPEKK